jgi:hypothetical protein
LRHFLFRTSDSGLHDVLHEALRRVDL